MRLTVLLKIGPPINAYILLFMLIFPIVFLKIFLMIQTEISMKTVEKIMPFYYLLMIFVQGAKYIVSNLFTEYNRM